MATQTCFNLNAALESWRKELNAQPQLTPDNRRELERHLADTMAELRQRGLNEEESFWLARRRIGQPRQLAEEFVKADPAKVWRERAFWSVASMIAFSVWGSISFSLTTFITLFLYSNTNFKSSNVWLVAVAMLRYVLLILLIIWLVASGRIARHSSKFSLFFSSRWRLGSAVILVVVISQIFSGLATWIDLGKHSAPGVIWQIFRMNLLSITGFLTLVGSLVWLMPKNQKTLQTR